MPFLLHSQSSLNLYNTSIQVPKISHYVPELFRKTLCFRDLTPLRCQSAFSSAEFASPKYIKTPVVLRVPNLRDNRMAQLGFVPAISLEESGTVAFCS